MSLRKKIFLRTSILLLLLIGTIAAILMVFTVHENRTEMKRIHLLLGRTLAGELQRFILWDDRVAIRQALMREMAAHDLFEYVFVVRAGHPYVDTFTNGVPPGLLRPATMHPEEAFAWDFRDAAGTIYYDLVVPVDQTNGVLRIGIQRRNLDKKVYPTLLKIAYVSIAAFLVGLIIAHRIALHATQDITLLCTAICSYGQENGEGVILSTTEDSTENVSALAASFRDLVSKRKQIEQLLVTSETHLRALIKTIPDLVWLKNDEGVFLACNTRFERLYGATEAEIVGKTDYDFVDRASADAFRERDEAAMARGEALVNEEEITYADDGHRVTVETIKTPMYDREGKLVGVLGIARDITERKRAEAEREVLQVQFAQAQKMESVGRLAGGVAHDFNNLLVGIMNYVELCRDSVGPEDPIRAYLDEITADARRSADLTHQLLAFARKQTIAPRLLDLNDAVASALKLLRRLIGEDIDMAWLPSATPWTVKMDPTQLDQVLANLAVNARDAIGGVGRLTIETENVTIPQAYCAEHVDARPGDYVLLAVSDDGCGMDQETVTRLFEPFFTTKGISEGTGLGLATVYGIVTQNNGFVNVYSEPEHGTTFKIYLPRCQGEAAAPVGGDAPTGRPRGHETILLVEDEKSIRVTATLFLRDLGYNVLTAENPAEALRLAAAQVGTIHLLVTDVILPGLSGRDLATKLAEVRPGIACLFMSGYTANVIAHQGVLDEGVNFLGKPFSRDELARKVRDVLDA